MEDFIQHSIKLTSFRATDVNFHEIEIQNSEDQKSFDMDMSFEVDEKGLKQYTQIFNIKLKYPVVEINKTLQIDITYKTLFETQNPIDKTFIESDFARVAIPAIGFPYLRAFISNLTSQAGYEPVILPSINFVKFVKSKLE